MSGVADTPTSNDNIGIALLSIDPREVLFEGIEINREYAKTVRISNHSEASLEFTVRPGNTERLAVTPSRVHLAPGREALIQIRLKLQSRVHNAEKSSGQKDVVYIHSEAFDQHFFVNFRTAKKPPLPPRHTPRSGAVPSPHPQSNVSDDDCEECNILREEKTACMIEIKDLKEEIALLKAKYAPFEESMQVARSTSGDVDDQIRSAVAAALKTEREEAEMKDRAVLEILQNKDALIASLKQKLADSERRNAMLERGHADTTKLEVEKAELMADKAELEARLHARSFAADQALIDEADALRQTVAKLTADLEHVRSDAANDGKEREDAMKSIIVRHTEAVKVAEQVLRDRDATIAALNDSVDSLKTELSRMNDDLCACRTDLSQRDSDADAGLSKVRHHCEELERQVVDLKYAKQSSERMYSEMEKQHEAQHSSDVGIIAQLNSRLTEAQVKLSEQRVVEMCSIAVCTDPPTNDPVKQLAIAEAARDAALLARDHAMVDRRDEMSVLETQLRAERAAGSARCAVLEKTIAQLANEDTLDLAVSLANAHAKLSAAEAKCTAVSTQLAATKDELNNRTRTAMGLAKEMLGDASIEELDRIYSDSVNLPVHGTALTDLESNRLKIELDMVRKELMVIKARPECVEEDVEEEEERGQHEFALVLEERESKDSALIDRDVVIARATHLESRVKQAEAEATAWRTEAESAVHEASMLQTALDSDKRRWQRDMDRIKADFDAIKMENVSLTSALEDRVPANVLVDPNNVVEDGMTMQQWTAFLSVQLSQARAEQRVAKHASDNAVLQINELTAEVARLETSLSVQLRTTALVQAELEALKEAERTSRQELVESLRASADHVASFRHIRREIMTSKEPVCTMIHLPVPQYREAQWADMERRLHELSIDKAHCLAEHSHDPVNGAVSRTRAGIIAAIESVAESSDPTDHLCALVLDLDKKCADATVRATVSEWDLDRANRLCTVLERRAIKAESKAVKSLDRERLVQVDANAKIAAMDRMCSECDRVSMSRIHILCDHLDNALSRIAVLTASNHRLETGNVGDDQRDLRLKCAALESTALSWEQMAKQAETALHDCKSVAKHAVVDIKITPPPRPATDNDKSVEEAWIAAVESDRDAARTDIEHLKTQINSAIRAFSEEAALIKHQGNDDTTRVAVLQLQLIDSKEECVTYRNALAQLQSTLSSVDGLAQFLDGGTGDKELAGKLSEQLVSCHVREADALRRVRSAAMVEAELRQVLSSRDGRIVDLRRAIEGDVHDFEISLLNENARAMAEISLLRTKLARIAPEHGFMSPMPVSVDFDQVALRDRIIELDLCNVKLVHGVVDRDVALSSLEQQLASSSGTIASMSNDLTVSRETIRSLESQLNELRTHLVSLDSDPVVEVESVHAETQTDVQPAIESSQTNVIDAAVQTGNDEIPALKEELKSSQAMLHDVQLRLEEKNKEIAALHKSEQFGTALNDLSARNEYLAVELATMKDKLERTEQGLVESDRGFHELEALYNDAQVSLSRLQTYISEHDFESLEQQCQESKLRAGRFEASLKAVETQSSVEAEKHAETVSLLEERLERAKNRIKRLVETDVGKRKRVVEKELVDMDATIVSLNAELRRKQHRKKRTKATDTVEPQVSVLQQRVHALNAELSLVKAQLGQMDESRVELEDKLVSAEDAVVTAQNARAAAIRERRDADLRVKELEKQCAGLVSSSNANNDLEDRVESLTSVLHSAERRAEQAEGEAEECRVTLATLKRDHDKNKSDWDVDRTHLHDRYKRAEADSRSKEQVIKDLRVKVQSLAEHESSAREAATTAEAKVKSMLSDKAMRDESVKALRSRIATLQSALSDAEAAGDCARDALVKAQRGTHRRDVQLRAAHGTIESLEASINVEPPLDSSLLQKNRDKLRELRRVQKQLTQSVATLQQSLEESEARISVSNAVIMDHASYLIHEAKGEGLDEIVSDLQAALKDSVKTAAVHCLSQLCSAVTATIIEQNNEKMDEKSRESEAILAKVRGELEETKRQLSLSQMEQTATVTRYESQLASMEIDDLDNLASTAVLQGVAMSDVSFMSLE